MIFLAVAAEAVDAVTFMLMVSLLGVRAEANPVVRTLGLSGSVVMKVALMVGVAALSYLLYEYSTRHVAARRQLMWSVLGVALMAGVVGSASNIRLLMEVSHAAS